LAIATSALQDRTIMSVKSIALGATLAAAAGAVGLVRTLSRRDRAKRRTVATDRHTAEQVADRHRAKVSRIAHQLRERTSDAPISLRKRAVSHQVPKAGDLRRLDDKIDISDLDAILHVDPVLRICVAEAGVTFVDLVAATLRHGLVPIVVPELKTITIGGAVSGCSIESMSYRYGGFHDTCLEYEVVTAQGDVLVCTPGNEHALVFHMMHGSFGTLGILTRLTFRLVPAKSLVKVDYETYDTLEGFRAAIWRRFEAQDVDFMDGIIHSPAKYVLCVANFVDTAPYTSRYDWVTAYWETTAKRREDYFTTEDYFFRYDRGVTSVIPRSKVARFFVGKVLSSSQVLRIAEKLRGLVLDDERPRITLDVFVPFSRVPAFLAWYADEFKHYPLWCVPYRRVHDYPWIADSFYADLDDALFLDLAIYGMEQPPGRNYHAVMEDKLRELGGIKTLIAHNYYSAETFWTIWNKPNYDKVKTITDPRNRFRDLYTKMCRAAMGRR
jgi:FAD/FMN-containing dehydrogenase